MKKILIVFGTRPEAIKMAPVIKKFIDEVGSFSVYICSTGQHREMLDQVLSFFDIHPDFDLALMRSGQNLYQLTSDVIMGMKEVLEKLNPDYVFVHGDTTTSSAAALASFYAGATVCHVEAGLRTYNKQSPFPEEVNRQLTARIADIHFAPTQKAAENLIKEGVQKKQIFVTGNTVIDALLTASEKLIGYCDSEIEYLKNVLHENKKIILVTGHRRENFGGGFAAICGAIKDIAENEDVQVVYPVHMNPNVLEPVNKYLSGCNNVHLVKPLAYPAFLWLMKKSNIILTDSGGVQEEAPSLGKPVLVMRETTERPEAVEAGTVLLVGTDRHRINSAVTRLLRDESAYLTMSNAHNPYGDGKASERILKILKEL